MTRSAWLGLRGCFVRRCSCRFPSPPRQSPNSYSSARSAKAPCRPASAPPMQTAITDRPVNTDPTPDPKTVGERVRTVCLVLITLCVMGATLYFLRPILTPLFIALFLFFLLKPVTGAVARWKIPYWVAYPVLCVFLVLVLLVIGDMVYSSARSFQERWPEYE